LDTGQAHANYINKCRLAGFVDSKGISLHLYNRRDLKKVTRTGRRKKMENKEKKLPEKKFRAGAICITIWRNETEKGSYYTAQLDRSYKDKNNDWQRTASMRLSDLPKAALLLNKAYEYLVLKNQATVEVETVM
jgi:hypothetical protein